MLFTPLPPVTNCHTFSDPLPLEHDVLYGQPLRHQLALNGSCGTKWLMWYYMAHVVLNGKHML